MKQDDARKEKKDQDKGCDEAAYDYDAQNSFSKKGNLEKATTWFAYMSSQTRNWSSVLRTKDSCKLEIVSKNGNEKATKNREGLGHLKFDIWKWPKRKKVDDTNYKFKHGKIKFDVWKWPRRKKEGQGAKSHECCVRCGAGLDLICSGHMEEGRSLMGIYFQLSGTGDIYHHFDTRLLYSFGLVHANNGKSMSLVHASHGESIKTFLLEILKMTTREVIHHGACFGLGLAALGTDHDTVVDGESTGMSMGLLKAGTIDETVEGVMLMWARKSGHEKMKQGLVLGIALVVHEGMKTIALAYSGTGNNKAVECCFF